ncbi:hypothetical protein SBY92_002735 [Candida maltosa Xu316]
MTDNKEEGFYKHSNESNATRITVPYSASLQVSNVGFNTLRKTNTNLSHSSNTSTSTTKPNSLSKLFTRNKSNSNVSLNPSTYTYDAEDEDDSASHISKDTFETKTSSGNKLKKKLKFSSRKGKPELRLDTQSIASGDSPFKKIRSSSSLTDMRPRKSSMGSPVTSTIHNLFHRSHHTSSSSQQQDGSSSNLQMSGKGDDSKKVLSLSSNSSNSVITDPELAKIYNFTSPNFSIEDGGESVDHQNAFLDIHKKMLVPADSYIQNKLNRYHQMEVGLGIVGTDLDNGRNIKIYTNLYHYLKPLFLVSSSSQKTNKRGMSKPVLHHSIEELASIVRECFCGNSSRSGKLSRTNTQTKLPTLENKIEDFDYYKTREVSQELMTLFTKNSDVSKTMTRSQWLLIIIAWRYFNRAIRFYVISIFQPLQIHFQELMMQKQPNNRNIQVNIDDLLLGAFYKVFILDSDINGFFKQELQIFGNSGGDTDEYTTNELFISTVSWLNSLV